ncbi:MAG: MaoC/PaaZ C-terminal domain-containing protein [Burkholderiales bacterium]
MTNQPRDPVREIGRRRFSAQDQEVFASLSFDRNPMHMDPVAARRLLTGLPVVHGVHVLLTALEYWVNDDALTPTLLNCSFNNPVNVDDTVVFSQKNDGPGRFAIEARVNGLPCAVLRMTAQLAEKQPVGKASGSELQSQAVSYFERVDVPLSKPPEEQLQRRYAIRIDDGDLSGHFPRAVGCLGSSRIAGLLCLSYFVGMVCPGLNSIFSTISLKLNDSGPVSEALEFAVDQYDERFRRFNVSFQGVLSGSLTAFLRPTPQPQLSMSEIAKRVVSGEFSGTRSLVIGASRGLGELTAKILAAGGGGVTISYAQGLADIEMVNAEINASGMGSCQIQRLDVTSKEAFDEIDFQALDAVYLFATPRIYRKKAEVFVGALFDEFLEAYVRSLYRLCLHIESIPMDRKIGIYVPSTVFIAERPDGLAEYAMAKAAAEVLIDDINRSFRRVSILSTRLPRLSTDQTSSVLKLPTGDNLGALLPVVRAMAR